MLDSVKISRRQSEIRQALAELAGKPEPTADEVRSMDTMDAEYRANESRFRAALIAEDTERRDAKGELETRADRQWGEMLAGYELRQAVLALDEGRALTGATKEIVEELRSAGGFRGIPVPLGALETRANETIASGVPSPMATMPIVDRLFAPTVAAKMGVAMINIPQGAQEWPITSSSVAGAWTATETGNVAGPVQFTTAERTLSPGSTYGVQLRVTRKALLQSGAGLEQAIRRDLSNAITVGLDRAIFLGAGSSGEPAGLLVGSYGITSTAIGATASWSAFRAAIMRFLSGNAAAGPSDVRVLIRPEIWSILDATLITSTATSEWDRMLNNVPAGNIALTSNALAAPTGSPLATTGVLMTSAGGLPPAFCGLWSSIDLIRDVYTDAQSGGVRLTGLLTADVTASRASQIEILTGLRIA